MPKYKLRIGTLTSRGDEKIVTAKSPRDAVKKERMPVQFWRRIVQGAIYTDGQRKVVRYLGKA